MATVTEVLVQALMQNINDTDRKALDTAANHFGAQLVRLASYVGRAVEAINCTIVQSISQIEITNRRRLLLQLYRQRRAWKTADIVRLNTYPLNLAARKRMAKLKGAKRVGRGVTIAYQPMISKLRASLQLLVKMYDPTTQPHRRLAMLKKTRWWPEFVEMTYRGEYLRLKKLGGKATSASAEQAVATACCISVATAKRLCYLVRKSAAAGAPMNDPIEVADFEFWKLTGQFPEQGTIC